MSKVKKIFDRETTIGILGGMGPYATNFFLKRILDLTPVKLEKDHFRTIIDNNVKIPSRTRAVKYNEQSPVNDIVNSINNLGKKTKVKSNPLLYINKLIKDFKIKIPNQLPSMSSMLVGYFSYDIIRYIEKIPDTCKDDLNIPDIRLSRPKNLVIYDNLKKTI